MTTNDHAKIYRAHRYGWTAADIAAVYGYQRSQVQRALARYYRKSPDERKSPVSEIRANTEANCGEIV